VVGVTVAEGAVFSYAFQPVADGDDPLHTVPNGGINKVTVIFSRDGIVNATDAAILAQHWLQSPSL